MNKEAEAIYEQLRQELGDKEAKKEVEEARKQYLGRIQFT